MRLLLVEDDRALGQGIRVALGVEGYTLDWLQDGVAALHALRTESFDLLLLDLGLPRLDGLDLLQQLRAEQHDLPVLILTARDGTAERIAGLDAGADDYLVKPFDVEELKARVRALLRQAPVGETQEAALQFGPLTVDLAYRRVLLDGAEVALTRKEYAVLAQLARHPGRVITQQQLLKDIWGPTHTDDSHYLRIVVGHLRQKLADDPTQPRFIVTEAGVGYRLLSA